MLKKAGNAWNLQDAKARLSELIDLASAGKPQVILRRGAPAAAVIPFSEYEAMRPRKSLVSFILDSPLIGSELEFPYRDEVYEADPDLFSE